MTNSDAEYDHAMKAHARRITQARPDFWGKHCTWLVYCSKQGKLVPFKGEENV